MKGTPILELRGLTKAFGGLIAVSDLDLTVVGGEIHGLIGPNGSGKSTTLNLVSGLSSPTRGRILFGGREITALPANERVRRGLARTFQNVRLFPRMSIADNVAVGRFCRTRAGLFAVLKRTRAMVVEETRTRRDALEALRLVGLEARAAAPPSDLPYGQQRLVEIARALATNPRVLLLDEPAAGMNPSEKNALLALIRKLNEQLQMTIVLVEHDMNLVMQACDRITVLNFGARIAAGAPGEVRRDPAVIEAYLGKGGGGVGA